MSTEVTKQAFTTKSTFAWLALAVVWVLTPFMGDNIPAPLSALYWVFLAVSVIYALVVAFKRRSWALGAFAVVTSACVANHAVRDPGHLRHQLGHNNISKRTRRRTKNPWPEGQGFITVFAERTAS